LSQSLVSSPGAENEEQQADFKFGGVPYFHRYAKDDLLEYTPKGQNDLNAWTDMVTLNFYRDVKDGDGLASIANRVLATYQAGKGVIVKTDSVPRTNDKPAEHLIVVIFVDPAFTEVAFTRLLMRDGMGMSVVYSYRIYGQRSANEMSAWCTQNGPPTEQKLMAWDTIPKVARNNH
jgi:hypothetical protein